MFRVVRYARVPVGRHRSIAFRRVETVCLQAEERDKGPGTATDAESFAKITLFATSYHHTAGSARVSQVYADTLESYQHIDLAAHHRRNILKWRH